MYLLTCLHSYAKSGLISILTYLLLTKPDRMALNQQQSPKTTTITLISTQSTYMPASSDASNHIQITPVSGQSSHSMTARTFPKYHQEKSSRKFVQQLTTSELTSWASPAQGSHSVRESLAMTMHLAKEPTYTIMLSGCWSSDVSLAFIKKKSKNSPRDSAPGCYRTELFTTPPWHETPNNHPHSIKASAIAAKPT